MGRLEYLKGKIDRDAFLKHCKDSFNLQPKHTVFIFPSNAKHHGKDTTLVSVKKGSGLAEVAQKLGESGYPTLGLPTKGMSKWPGDKTQCEIVDSALYNLFRAVGAGYNVVLPVRERKEGKDAFEHDLAACKGYELSFWGGVVKPDNPKLAAHYDGMVSILDTFMKVQDNTKRLIFLQNMLQLAEAHAEAYKDRPENKEFIAQKVTLFTQNMKSAQITFAQNIPGILEKIIREPDGLHAIENIRNGYTGGQTTPADSHWLMPSYLEKYNAIYKSAPRSTHKSKIPDEQPFFDGATALLQDYTHKKDLNKTESCSTRFFRAAANAFRHNTQAVDTILANIRTYDNPGKLIASLKAITEKDGKPINPQGALARTIEVLECKLKVLQDKSPTEELDLPLPGHSPRSQSSF